MISCGDVEANSQTCSIPSWAEGGCPPAELLSAGPPATASDLSELILVNGCLLSTCTVFSLPLMPTMGTKAEGKGEKSLQS